MGAAERLIMQNRRVRAGREWQRKHFWMAHERTVVCLHPKTPAARGSSEPPPPLMKFDIVEMTGAMTALYQDSVCVGGGCYKLAHLCTAAPLSKVSA